MNDLRVDVTANHMTAALEALSDSVGNLPFGPNDVGGQTAGMLWAMMDAFANIAGPGELLRLSAEFAGEETFEFFLKHAVCAHRVETEFGEQFEKTVSTAPTYRKKVVPLLMGTLELEAQS